MNTLYRPGLLALIAVALVVGFVTGMSKLEISLYVITMAVIWLALEIDKIRDASGKSLRERYAKIIKQIEEGEAVEPKHNPPAQCVEFGENKQMFYDYVAFADKVNEQLQYGGWRLQEEADGDGVRNYLILYNGTKTGRLKLRAGASTSHYMTADTEIYASVNLWHARLLLYGTVHEFLGTIIWFINGDTVANYERAVAGMEHSLVTYLWNAVGTPEGMPTLSLIVKGRPLAYFDQGELHERNKRYWANLGVRPKAAAANQSG